MKVTIIIPAGGSSERFGKAKLLENIHGRSVIEHSIQAFLSMPQINQIIIPCHANLLQSIQNLIPKHVHCILGGNSRAESVFKTIAHIPTETTHILIHDGARPNISSALITNILNALQSHPVVIPGIPVTDTIKTISTNTITGTINRDTLSAVQTPQGFCLKTLKEAYTKIKDISKFTDEASLLESQSIFGTIIPGDPKNIKLTQPEDLNMLSYLMKKNLS